MYISQIHLCFYKSTFGLSTKLKISWLDITEIVNKDSSKVVIKYNKTNDGKLEKEELVFSGFGNRDQSSKYIIKLWRSAKGIESDSEADSTSSKKEIVKEVKIDQQKGTPKTQASETNFNTELESHEQIKVPEDIPDDLDKQKELA